MVDYDAFRSVLRKLTEVAGLPRDYFASAEFVSARYYFEPASVGGYYVYKMVLRGVPSFRFFNGSFRVGPAEDFSDINGVPAGDPGELFIEYKY